MFGQLHTGIFSNYIVILIEMWKMHKLYATPTYQRFKRKMGKLVFWTSSTLHTNECMVQEHLEAYS